MWAGYCSRYSDWLRAWRSGDRIPVWARFSTPVQIGPGAHPAFYEMGTGSFPGEKSGRGMMLTPHPLLVPWSWKGRAIPLLPLWAVRPVQSLSVCTRVHFTYLYPIFYSEDCTVNVYWGRKCDVTSILNFITTCTWWLGSYCSWVAGESQNCLCVVLKKVSLRKWTGTIWCTVSLSCTKHHCEVLSLNTGHSIVFRQFSDTDNAVNTTMFFIKTISYL